MRNRRGPTPPFYFIEKIQSFPRIPERSCASSTEPYMDSYDSRVGFTFSGVMNPMNLSDSLIVRVFR